MEILEKSIQSLSTFNMQIQSHYEKSPVVCTGLFKSAHDVVPYVVANDLLSDILVYICPNNMIAKKIKDNLSVFDVEVNIYPAKELRNFDVISQSLDILEQRMNVIQNILSGKKQIVITTPEAICQGLVPKEQIQKLQLKLSKNAVLTAKKAQDALYLMGYVKEDMCYEKNTFSQRGYILDVATDEQYGIRAEFWGDEITQIWKFDIATGQSLEKLDEVTIFPLTENISNYSKEKIVKILQEEYESGNILDAKEVLKEDLKELENNDNYTLNMQNIVEKYLVNIYKEDTSNIIEYIQSVYKNITYCVYDSEGILERLESLKEQMQMTISESIQPRYYFSSIKYYLENIAYIFDNTLYEYLRKGIIEDEKNVVNGVGTKVDIFCKYGKKYELNTAYIFTQDEDILSQKELANICKDTSKIAIASYPIVPIATNWKEKDKNGNPFYFDIFKKLDKISEYNESIKGKNGKKKVVGDFPSAIFFCGSDIARCQMLIDQMQEKYKFDASKIVMQTGVLKNDFKITFDSGRVLCVYNIANAFISKEKVDRKNNIQEVFFEDLSVGDYVVHRIHGIGKFVDVNTFTTDGVTKDYIKLEYKNNSFLYIPTDDLSNISKYVGADGYVPKLSDLGKKDWTKQTAKVAKNLKEVAGELVELYAKRANIHGFKFAKDTKEQAEFEATFPYQETQDQLRCIKQIKQDMESPKVMDRLLCGDVGFGKTEVAIRATFKAVCNLKQVAYIAPTTTLAYQQYQDFEKRLSPFGIKVAHLSRLTSAKEVREIKSGLLDQKIDVVIGTHKILGKDIQFADLGLLIIDEEHKFGVRDKEKIQLLKNKVDVLTMSATPIPRTLNLSLTGIKDISIIYEAPKNRLPIKTYLIKNDNNIIKEAITKELERKGQVFYVHNRVQDIEFVVKDLQKLLPFAKIAYVTGQMDKESSRDTIAQFIDKKIDVLVCTTILESGIDIPNANTIIIQTTEKMGLAQLYQIRGRVGRSQKQAYAYIVIDSKKKLSQNTKKRIQALKEFTALGSGFKIAMKDMQIRGAGSLLGEKQSGHLEQVGYQTYCDLLNKQIEKIAKEKGVDLQVDEGMNLPQIDSTVDLGISAYIPDNYVSLQKYKMDIYKELINCHDVKTLEGVANILASKYGTMPIELQNFVSILRLRIKAAQKGIVKVLKKVQKSIYSSNTNQPSYLKVSGLKEDKVQVDFYVTKEFNLDNFSYLISKYTTNVMFKEIKKDNDKKENDLDVKQDGIDEDDVEATFGITNPNDKIVGILTLFLDNVYNVDDNRIIIETEKFLDELK